MGKIYTKKGDGGQTSSIVGKMSKAAELPEALGTIDELNVWVGWCRIKDDTLEEELKRIQTNLFNIASLLAGGAGTVEYSEVGHLEKLIDELEGKLPQITNFVYPSGELHVARVVCRRAERAVARLIESCQKEFDIEKCAVVRQYINRLSDALFVMARYINQKRGIMEETWNKKN